MGHPSFVGLRDGWLPFCLTFNLLQYCYSRTDFTPPTHDKMVYCSDHLANISLSTDTSSNCNVILISIAVQL